MLRLRLCFVIALFGLCGCTMNAAQSNVPNVQHDSFQTLHSVRRTASSSPIAHVVIIVQENRTVDNLFQSLPGANTQSYGFNSRGQKIVLQSQPLNVPYDLTHKHSDWRNDYAKGAMNGFDSETCKRTCPSNPSYSYVQQSDLQPYFSLAETYTFADEMFETDQGPSFPAHQYLVSGTATVSDGSSNEASSNPLENPQSALGGCDSPPGTLVSVITPRGQQPPSLETFPCFQRQSLMNEMDSAGVTWKYYQDRLGAGLWHAVDAIHSIWSNPSEMAANVITPPSQVLTDIGNGKLADVVWVTPTAAASDHAGSNNGTGPSWVASVVNAIGQSQYWNNTAIFITWDDWGGWYDHIAPTIYSSFELGFRVPLIVVSPYAKAGYVSHKQHEFGSILKFTEETFGLPSLGTTDGRADNLSDCFNFRQKVRHFKPVHTDYRARYFLTAPSTGLVDDE